MTTLYMYVGTVTLYENQITIIKIRAGLTRIMFSVAITCAQEANLAYSQTPDFSLRAALQLC
jgi:hypothetical protein